MIAFKINVLLNRLAGKVPNKIGIHIVPLLREIFFSVFKAVNVIVRGNKQTYTMPKGFRFFNKIILSFSYF